MMCTRFIIAYNPTIIKIVYLKMFLVVAALLQSTNQNVVFLLFSFRSRLDYISLNFGKYMTLMVERGLTSDLAKIEFLKLVPCCSPRLAFDLRHPFKPKCLAPLRRLLLPLGNFLKNRAPGSTGSHRF